MTSTNGTTLRPNGASPATFVTVRQAATMLGVAPYDVLLACESGALPSAHVGALRVVRPEAVRAFADSLLPA